MRRESLVSITDYSKEDILDLLEKAKSFEQNPNRRVLEGKVIATLFFEPSTRTRLSFETAVNRLGGRVIGFSDASTTSSTKGETLKDTIMMVSNYVDLIIMRHYLDGAARYASEVASVPIINAGDGANQHPSQTMLDLYSIYKTQGTLENLNITMVGDLKYGRTVHSLVNALSRYDHINFVLISPTELKLPRYVKEEALKKKGIPYTQTTDLESVIPQLDILYMTRVQKERFFNEEDYLRLKDSYILTPEKLENAKADLSILHPLPRVNEITVAVDKDPRAAYWRQVKNGKYIRMALILKLLGIQV